jgi:heme-degrading monooxygenase HmoA
MFAVIFEVEPAPGRRQDYLDIAAQLRPELEQIDGFISVERFQSLTQDGKILSLSFWRDEEAVVRWRRHEQHRDAQRAGRGGIFRITACGSPPLCATTGSKTAPRRRSLRPKTSLKAIHDRDTERA